MGAARVTAFSRHPRRQQRTRPPPEEEPDSALSPFRVQRSPPAPSPFCSRRRSPPSHQLAPLHEAMMKRRTVAGDADLADWQPGCVLEDDAPATKRARFARTADLLHELQQHVSACLQARAKKDAFEREASRRLADNFPLTFTSSEPVGRPRSTSPRIPTSAPSPHSPDQNSEVCKDTPCLAPTPIVATPATTEKRASELSAEPPSLCI